MQRYKTGDIVEVKSLSEVLGTLDANGAYEGVPFMQEMHAYCGRRFRVFKRADKICVEREWLDFRRLRNAVFLEEVRCDGAAHDGCQKLCLIFWKEVWLKAAPAGAEPEPPIDWVTVPRVQPTTEVDETKAYYCQSTTALHATEPISGWDPRQYIRDLQSGALRPLEVIRVVFIEAYNKIAKKFGRPDFGVRFGTLTRTPLVQLGLRQGDVVRVKTPDQIVSTLDKMGRNRGLGFAYDMEQHCTHTRTVITPVNRMILETTGRMRKLSNTVLLQGAACTGLCNRGCARNGHPLWREAWLEPIRTSTTSESTAEFSRAE